ncbi:Hst3 protein [Colletotrichum orchidophilum]|uniref:Hst3 protein n=1 Tax=Colletotrichum orchidophilum TaxID=1209926 RepID=A0A1G4AMP0_9PEZI|nr:Hst3 protein [Colletotrichum orchidophilum]OHE90450.1 Hst3 protein [Colletotrichum orchidophilum]
MPTTQVTPTEDVLLQGIAESLFKARKVVVITGAGISTNSGIPDFRSENGLYSLIQAQFDAANRVDVVEPRGFGSADVNREEREPPAKRRRLSFEDSGICLSDDSQDSQISTDAERFRSNAVGTPSQASVLQGHSSTVARSTGPVTRARSRESTVDDRSARQNIRTDDALITDDGAIFTRSSMEITRAQSSPPDEGPRKDLDAIRCLGALEAHSSPAQTDRAARSYLRRRGRSASPCAQRANAYQASSAEMRKRSLLTSTVASVPGTESNEAVISTSGPNRPSVTLSKAGVQLEEGHHSFDPTLKTSVHITPKASRFFFSSSPLSSPPSIFPQTPTFQRDTDRFTRSTLRQQPMGFSSSPLSSPPPVLFDPFKERSSSTSRQASSVASSVASSETDETPPSSQPSKSILPNIKGRDLFDASIWADPLRTSVFYTFATTLREKIKDVEPTESHHFIGHLRNRGKLVRCYTQNIDQIEEKVGLSTSLQEGPGHRGRFSRKSVGAVLATAATGSSLSEPVSATPEANESKDLDESRGSGSGGVAESADATASAEPQAQQHVDKKSNGVECVFLHGSLESLRCFLCGKICDWDEADRSHETLSGRQPECPYCAGATAARQERGKRALGVGKLRPDIVLYGEEHPNAHLISPIVTHDLGLSPDLLLILGTSLKVHGLKILVREFAKTIHSRGGKVVFVNFTKPPESSWGDIIDYWVQWDCDAWVSNLKERVPLLWLPPGTKLPKKKKESNEKMRKRQSSADEKPRIEAVKPSATSSTDLPHESQSETTLKPEKSCKASEFCTAQKPDKLVKIERLMTPPEIAAPKNTPQRPMAVRDDKTNAAWVTWKVMAELRRIVGSIPPTTSASPVALRVEKAKTRRPKKSASAAISRPSPILPDQPGESFQRRPIVAEMKQENGPPELILNESVGAQLAMPGAAESSIFAAVKINPRMRKRKTIDGEEIFVPGMLRPVAVRPASLAKALPRPTPRRIKSTQVKERPVVVSPKILSDIQHPSMDSLTLPPLQTTNAPAASLSKPQPMEPLSSPAGPLSAISSNTQTRIDPRIANPFFLSDPLLLRLIQAPDWTPPQTHGFKPPKVER